jgi:glycosyltransferase involved in cell wall biosynthesis
MVSSKVNIIKLSSKDNNRFTQILNAFFRLCKYFIHTDTTVIMSTIKELNIFTIIIKFITISKIKLLIREADTLDRIYIEGGLNNKILLFLMRKLYPRASGVIANSKITQIDLIEKLGLKERFVKTIYNPLDLSHISNKIQKQKREAYKLVSCGRLHYKKNFSDLIKTIPMLIDKYPNISLDILGEGPERKNLQNLIDRLKLGKYITLVGFVENPYVYYARANVFIQTSLWEGFGYVLAEAMACGTSVVSYDGRGAMREILKDGMYGKLTPVGDLNSLADAISRQLENPTPQELLSEAVERFNLETISQQYLDVLR